MGIMTSEFFTELSVIGVTNGSTDWTVGGLPQVNCLVLWCYRNWFYHRDSDSFQRCW